MVGAVVRRIACENNPKRQPWNSVMSGWSDRFSRIAPASAEEGERPGTNAASVDLPFMTESSSSEFEQEDFRGPLPTRRAPWIYLVLILLAVASAGLTAFWFTGGAGLAPTPPPPVPQDTAATTRITSLERQLELFEADLAAQKSEIRRLSDEVAALNNKIYAMQQSYASAPAPSAAKGTGPVKRGPASPTGSVTAARP
jgi:hypothetical protein